MRLLSFLRSLVASRFHRSTFDSDVEEELRSHIQHRADDLARSGIDRTEAERRARIEFGAYVRYKEESYERPAAYSSRPSCRTCATPPACCANRPTLPR